MWPFSSNSSSSSSSSNSQADQPTPALASIPPSPPPPPAREPAPATTPPHNPYSLEAYQPLVAPDLTSPAAPPAFAPVVPVDVAQGEEPSRPKRVNVQPPLLGGARRPPAATTTGAEPTASSSSSSSSAPAEPDVTTRPMTPAELSDAQAAAARSAQSNALTPGGSVAAALTPAAQFLARQAAVNCSDLRAEFDRCARASLMSGSCEGLKRTWQGCVDEQKDILGKLSFGKAGNTLAQDLYLAALADQTGLERRAALAAGRGETVPSTSPAAGVDPAGSPLDADKDTSTKAPSSFAPLLARDLPSRSPTGDLEHPLERRARQAAELTARREAAERTLASEGSVFERVGAWVELGRLGWAEGTWEGGRGWGAGTSASKENA